MSYLPITDREADHLAWLHSNKFTTPEIFWKKFFPGISFQYACRVLKNYSSPEKGLLHVEKPHRFLSSYYFLTAGAIRSLDEKNRILVRSTKYPVKINPFEREHDLMVQRIRIAFEANDDLKNIFWVSDFEMRSGITPSVKGRFQGGNLDKARWRSSWSEERNKSRRTPDGFFEADIDGQRYAFALELENTPRSERKIYEMVEYLNDSFTDVYKLVVSANDKNTVRMFEALRVIVRKNEQAKWFVSYFERATTQPFKKIFHQLNQPVGSFQDRV